MEFRNASKWQAELLFRNFFPSTDDDNAPIEGDLDSVEIPTTPPTPTVESVPSRASISSTSSLWSSFAGVSNNDSTTSLSLQSESAASSSAATSSSKAPKAGPADPLRNQAYLPPQVEDDIAACKHSAPPLDGVTLSKLAKEFADAIPEEEFSVAALQGCTYLLACSALLVLVLPHTTKSSLFHPV